MKSKIIVKAAAVTTVVVFAFLFGIMYMQYSGSWPTATSALPRDADLGSRAIEFQNWDFTLSNESVVSLHDFRGTTLVLELMATWCSACKSQIPLFQNLESIRGNEIVLLALSVDISETPAMMADYKINEGFDWDCGVEDAGTFSEYLDVSLIPTILIIDSSGLLRWIHEGTWDSLSMNDTLTTMGI